MKERLEAFAREQFNEIKDRAEVCGYKVITRWRPGIKGIRLGDIVLGSRTQTHDGPEPPLLTDRKKEFDKRVAKKRLTGHRTGTT